MPRGVPCGCPGWSPGVTGIHPQSLPPKLSSFLPLACKVLGPGDPFSGLGLTRVWKPGRACACP